MTSDFDLQKKYGGQNLIAYYHVKTNFSEVFGFVLEIYGTVHK
jgi:hypothetical protein